MPQLMQLYSVPLDFRVMPQVVLSDLEHSITFISLFVSLCVLVCHLHLSSRFAQSLAHGNLLQAAHCIDFPVAM